MPINKVQEKPSCCGMRVDGITFARLLCCDMRVDGITLLDSSDSILHRAVVSAPNFASTGAGVRWLWRTLRHLLAQQQQKYGQHNDHRQHASASSTRISHSSTPMSSPVVLPQICAHKLCLHVIARLSSVGWASMEKPWLSWRLPPSISRRTCARDLFPLVLRFSPPKRPFE